MGWFDRRRELIAAGFDPAKHPHRPAGTRQGGQFAPKVGDQIEGMSYKGEEMKGEVIEVGSYGPVVMSDSNPDNIQTIRPETVHPVSAGQADATKTIPAVAPPGGWQFKQKHNGRPVRITGKGEIYAEAETHTSNPHIPAVRTFKVGSTKNPVKYAQKKIDDGVWEHA